MTLSPNNAYDNQAETGRRIKPKGKRRRRFAIEYRLVSQNGYYLFGLENWTVHSRYDSSSRRDQAYAALVSKSEREMDYGATTEWRKRDD